MCDSPLRLRDRCAIVAPVMPHASSATLYRRRVLLFATLAAIVLSLTPGGGSAASHGPFPGFTGAPKEDTCRHCHDSYALNPSGGSILISGFPASYQPGTSYPVTVALASDTASRWGFQATVLTEKNKRAGKFVATDAARTKVVDGYFIPNRDYIEQKAAGTFRGTRGGVSWTFTWQAPKVDKGPVTIFVSGNAANDNGKPTGDFVYFARTTSLPAS
jgi:hypothetical protein